MGRRRQFHDRGCEHAHSPRITRRFGGKTTRSLVPPLGWGRGKPRSRRRHPRRASRRLEHHRVQRCIRVSRQQPSSHSRRHLPRARRVVRARTPGRWYRFTDGQRRMDCRRDHSHRRRSDEHHIGMADGGRRKAGTGGCDARRWFRRRSRLGPTGVARHSQPAHMACVLLQRRGAPVASRPGARRRPQRLGVGETHRGQPRRGKTRRLRHGGLPLETMFDGNWKSQVERAVRPMGESLRRAGVTPDVLTIVGLVLAVAAAVAIGMGALRAGLLLVILAALPDLLDGAVAKAGNLASQRGAFFDSVIDRVTDGFLLGGIAWFLVSRDGGHIAILPMAVMGVSSTISYERAKAESLGLQAKGGLMERAERIILLCIGLLFDSALVPILWVMLVLTSITAVQRFSRVWSQAAVAPIAEVRIEQRQVRRASRKAARLQRRASARRRAR
ncbi:MAG: CDP-alcohol phosphatidyltransferase family protein [Actinobacteria bacterium]|nr:CDP-alcohol phosphatidyltransferase family protein [Actinomycetota bacterium]